MLSKLRVVTFCLLVLASCSRPADKTVPLTTVKESQPREAVVISPTPQPVRVAPGMRKQPAGSVPSQGRAFLSAPQTAVVATPTPDNKQVTIYFNSPGWKTVTETPCWSGYYKPSPGCVYYPASRLTCCTVTMQVYVKDSVFRDNFDQTGKTTPRWDVTRTNDTTITKPTPTPIPTPTPTPPPTPTPVPTPTPTPPPLCPLGQCNSFGLCQPTPGDQCRTLQGACSSLGNGVCRAANGDCKPC